MPDRSTGVRRFVPLRSLIPWSSLLLMVGCTAPDTSGVLLIGHGGLGPSVEHPMNSADAIRGALVQGLDGVEIDVQLTADSVLVAHHDLDGPCTRRIADLSWSELTTCSGDHEPFRGVRLDELIPGLQAQHPDAEFTFDVKLATEGEWWTYLHRFSRAIARFNVEADLNGQLLVECRSEDLLRTMMEEAPTIPRFLYVDEVDGAITRAATLACSGITIHVDALDSADAERIRAEGLSLTVFGVGGNWTMRRAMRLRPDRVQVDR